MDSGENDRRLILLTQEYGRIDVIAKGARKSGSRLAGSSEPLTRGRFTWAEGRFRRFVTQVEPSTSYPRLRADYGSLMAALAVAEVVSWALPAESPSIEIYELCLESFDHLSSEADPSVVLAWSLARALAIEGHSPSWTTCQDTGAKLAWTPAAFSASHGGLMQSPALSRFQDVIWIEAEVLVGLEMIGQLDAPPNKFKHDKKAVSVLISVWKNVLEHDLPTCQAFLREMKDSGE